MLNFTWLNKIKIYSAFIILLILPACPVFGQLNNSGDLKSYIYNIIAAMPTAYDNNDYKDPTITQLDIWERIVTDIINAQYLSAHNRADSIGYEVVHFTDTEPNPDKDYYILQKHAASLNYWGTYIFNQSPNRMRLIIESPHPRFDFNTDKQGFLIFKNLGARVFCLSGTHRCNSSTLSTCDGTTDVCTGSLESFRISDQAHNINGMLQRTTTTLSSLITNVIVFQPHGFTKDPGDPDLIMSNGSKKSPAIDYLSTLKAQLLLIDPDLTFKIVNVDTTWEKLNALTNTQGRFINGSIDPCDDNAPANTGRFLHIEQVKDSLRDTETNLLKLSNALANTFPVEPLPVELISFTAARINYSITLKWQTATEVNNYGFFVERSQKSGVITAERDPFGRSQEENSWKEISFVRGNGNSNSIKEYSYTDANLSEGNYLYRLKQMDNDGKFEYSKTVEASVSKPVEFALEQNYPNPFNPNTNFRFRVSNFGLVTLKVYDILGSEIATIVNQELEPGEYHFQFSAGDMALNQSTTGASRHFSLSSGIYYYTLTSGGHSVTKKLILLK